MMNYEFRYLPSGPCGVPIPKMAKNKKRSRVRSGDSVNCDDDSSSPPTIRKNPKSKNSAAEDIVADASAHLCDRLWREFGVNFEARREEMEGRMWRALHGGDRTDGMRGSMARGLVVMQGLVDEAVFHARREYYHGIAIDACRAVFDPEEMDRMEEGGVVIVDDNYMHDSAADSAVAEVLAKACPDGCEESDEAALRARMVREARRVRARCAMESVVTDLEHVLPVWDRLVRREEIVDEDEDGDSGAPCWPGMSEEHRQILVRVRDMPRTLRREAARIYVDEMERLERDGIVLDFYFTTPVLQWGGGSPLSSSPQPQLAQASPPPSPASIASSFLIIPASPPLPP
jgi:hypothetical protein